MDWKECARQLALAYENGNFDPEDLDEVESFRYVGHYADENMYLKEDEDDGKSIE